MPKNNKSAMPKRKIVITLAIIIILAAALIFIILPKLNSSNPTVNITLKQLGADGSYHDVDISANQTDSNVLASMQDENMLSDLLSELNWIDRAIIGIAPNNSAVTAYINTNCNPNQNELNEAVEIITLHLDGLDKENIIFADQNGIIIYPIA